MVILSSSQALFSRKRGPVTFSEADVFLAQFFADAKASCFAGRQFLVKLKPLAVSFHVMIHFICHGLPDTEHSMAG